MAFDFVAILPLISALLMAAAVLLVSATVVHVRSHAPKERSLALIAALSGGASASMARAGMTNELPRARPFEGAGRRIITAIGAADSTRRRLAFAGRAGEDDFAALAAKKVMALGVGLALGVLMAAQFGGVWWLAVPILAASGFLLPDLTLVNAAQKRTDEVRRRLPDAIDLLNLCVESGMGFQAALSQVAATQDGPVAEELSRVLREMQLGQSRHQALRSLAARTKQEDLLRFINAMNQVDRLGIPISSVLREQAKEMRARRRDRARERAQKVPVKIMLPVVFCFFPVLIGIVIAPAGIQIMRMFASM
jgi:tight adherence protein C